MPAERDCIGVVLYAFTEAGWSIAKADRLGTGDSPTIVEMTRGQQRTSLLLYAWTATHEGKTRTKDNLRVQWTPSHRDEPVPFKRGLLPMGLGWWPDRKVFFAFDVWTKRLAKYSSSIHVHRDTLESASVAGKLVTEDRAWDPRAAAHFDLIEGLLAWTAAQSTTRREALIAPISPPTINGTKAVIEAKVWGGLATSYVRPKGNIVASGDDIVLVGERKRLVDHRIWRIDSVHVDATTKPQIATLTCHQAGVVNNEAQIVARFSA